MTNANSQLRSELEGKFQPPIDVLLDPSLLVASTSLETLPESPIFQSQRQATLGQMPAEPRLGDLYVPAAFRELIEQDQQLDVQKTRAWNFYRGQAEGAYRDEIITLLDENDVDEFSDVLADSDRRWETALDSLTQEGQLVDILREELAFLRNGGVVLSRTPAFLQTLRDAGVPTVDLGQAELEPELRETLTDIGFTNPASTCAFAVSSAEATVDALVGGLLEDASGLLLYQLDS